jgi:hypothetical protein
LQEFLDNEEIAPFRSKLSRVHTLVPNVLRVVWLEEPTARERAVTEAIWATWYPRGRVEHVVNGATPAECT